MVLLVWRISHLLYGTFIFGLILKFLAASHKITSEK